MPDDALTRATWRTPPHHVRGFRQVADVLPTAAVANDPGAIRALPPDPRPLDGFTLRPHNRPPLDFDGFLRATDTDAIVVLRDGRLVLERYANGMDAATPHILMSATKSVVGLLAALLIEDGTLDPDRPVADLLPVLARSPYAAATPRALLDMRFNPDFSATDLGLYQAASAIDAAPADPTFGLRRFFAAMTGEHRPYAGAFRYVSANTDLLGWLLEAASGRPFAALLAERLWRPMGAERPAAIVTDPVGAPWCTGGLCATARDLARIGQLLLDDDRRVLSEAIVEDLATGGDAAAWADGEFAAGFAGRRMRYRNSWYAVDGHPPLLFAMGIHGQNLFVDRANGIVIAKVSSQPQRTERGMLMLTHLAVPEIRRNL